MSGMLRGLLVALLIIVVLGGASLGWISWRVNRETVMPVQAVNPGGTAGRALAVLSPGMSRFPARVLEAYEQGLVERDWEIDRTTASIETPADFGSYDLVVLASPIYGGKVAPPMLAYVGRAGDFGGKRVAVLVTAGGPAAEPAAAAKALVEGQGATVADVRGYAVYAPNDRENRYQGSNTERAAAMAHDAALALADSLK